MLKGLLDQLLVEPLVAYLRRCIKSVRCLPLTKETYKKQLDLHIRPALGKYELTAIWTKGSLHSA